MTNTRKRLVIAADDYGISPAVSLGIRELAARGRVTATGAMTLMPSWRKEAPALREMADVLDVGLHLTLTDQRPLGPMPTLAPKGRLPPVSVLLRRSLMGAIPAAEVEAELRRQLDAFETAMGRPPDFLDGHQHVHVFAGIRTVVLGMFRDRLNPGRCWLRDCHDRLGAILRRRSPAKALLISTLAGPSARAARSLGIAVNHGFSGFYTRGDEGFGPVFPSLLAGAGDGHLLMMHPGHVDEELRRVDPLTSPRQAEWDFLAGDGLHEVLDQLGFALTTGSKSWQTPPP